ncbi:hypothetical protein K443DRAFT_15227 [Laccaria amethystina LaAM-08-1]|uniref:Uncharacterized protein n=1 Tax=Laccaria amethystina LaAM-08-1 TaxID=1095629 RepID=A0A0C9WRH0_9AGAR|nr:hypothetical protein K443DRAFT_15227 [Laccaria amethystina LaAM-08-1]
MRNLRVKIALLDEASWQANELAFMRSGSRQYTSWLKDDNEVAYITFNIHGLACLEVVVKVVMVDDLASSNM